MPQKIFEVTAYIVVHAENKEQALEMVRRELDKLDVNDAYHMDDVDEIIPD